MEIKIIRTYQDAGTNGQVFLAEELICYSIELPWKNNAAGISCIPEGSYEAKKRWSPKFKWHLHLTDVPNREMILVHPANNALLELRGCMAPVTVLTAAGEGSSSRLAFGKLTAIVFDAMDKKEKIIFTFSSEIKNGTEQNNDHEKDDA